MRLKIVRMYGMYTINGLFSKIELVAVNIISKLKDKTTWCFSITSNYIWCCVQCCSLDIGGVSFKVDLPTPLKIPSCSFKQVFKFMIINSVDTHHFNLVLKLTVSETWSVKKQINEKFLCIWTYTKEWQQHVKEYIFLYILRTIKQGNIWEEQRLHI